MPPRSLAIACDQVLALGDQRRQLRLQLFRASSSARRLTPPSRSRSSFSRSSGARSRPSAAAILSARGRRWRQLSGGAIAASPGMRRSTSSWRCVGGLRAAPRRARVPRGRRSQRPGASRRPCRQREPRSRPRRKRSAAALRTVSASLQQRSAARGACRQICRHVRQARHRPRFPRPALPERRRSARRRASARSPPLRALGVERRQPARPRLGLALQPVVLGARLGIGRALAVDSCRAVRRLPAPGPSDRDAPANSALRLLRDCARASSSDCAMRRTALRPARCV